MRTPSARRRFINRKIVICDIIIRVERFQVFRTVAGAVSLQHTVYIVK